MPWTENMACKCERYYSNKLKSHAAQAAIETTQTELKHEYS